MTSPGTGSWKRQLHAHAAAPLEPFIARLPDGQVPGCDDLNALREPRHRNAGGAAIRFVASADAGEGYEERIFRCGEVITRPGSWHDLFNALAWLSFPQAKRALNFAHHEHLLKEDRQRGAARDVLTLFDESGVLVACGDASLASLLSGFEWKRLFVERRADVLRRMRCFVFGHGLQEQLLRPYPGITGKALILECDASFMRLPLAEQLRELDSRAAARITDGQTLASTRDLAPLPLLGLPGWDAASERPEYYDNTAVFRPGRRKG